MTPLLQLEDVRARYGGVRALHGVSLTVEDGESVAILGANGAGKTTTLRAISGTVRRSGSIVFGGKQIQGKSPESVARLGIAHVPEGREIYAELTVWENLLIGANHRRNWREAKRDCENVAGYFPQIAGRRNQQAGTLSGGEQQMLALARALVARPRLLLLDEPSLGLAPTIVRSFYDLVTSLTHEMGLTVLVVEQNAGIALQSTKRAYVLEVGRVVMEGASEELREDERVRKSYLG
ncbi:MAG TPA: ABC transporter ATP-binding protein [Gaiellaceae bacterium]|nr:ABC transporter ATP-binding protein [Gaiellaceae bacterium]